MANAPGDGNEAAGRPIPRTGPRIPPGCADADQGGAVPRVGRAGGDGMVPAAFNGRRPAFPQRVGPIGRLEATLSRTCESLTED